MIRLVLDASTYAGDVALLDDENLLTEEAIAMKGAHEERLMPAVAAVLERGGRRLAEVDQIVCGAGPGSFTSLRIAGAIAKGLAVGIGRPLYVVPSLALIVAADVRAPGRYLAAVDALRSEFYVALYDVQSDGSVIEEEAARLVPADRVEAVAEAYEAKLISPTAYVGAVRETPRARGVARLLASLRATSPVDLGSWEPAYGRLAEAQVKWETTHGRPLPVG